MGIIPISNLVRVSKSALKDFNLDLIIVEYF